MGDGCHDVRLPAAHDGSFCTGQRTQRAQVVVLGMVIAKASLIVGFAFQLIFSLAKLIYYAVGWSYLRRATARRWLENT